MTFRKPKRREVVLFLTLAASVYFTVSLDSKTKRMKNANKKLRSSKGTAGPAMPILQTGIARRSKRIETGDTAPGWGMDPFNRMFTMDEDDEDSGGGNPEGWEETDNVVLQGVAIAGGAGAALINGVICAEGDTLNGLLVERIENNTVRLRRIYDGSTFIIDMQ